MSTYLQIVNNNNSTVIDDSNARLVLKRKIVLSNNYLDFQYDTWYGGKHFGLNCSLFRIYKIPKLEGEKICFAKCSNSNYGIACYNDDDCHVVTIFYYDSCDPSAVTVYIFSDAKMLSNKNYGVNIYNENGSLIFDSNNMMLSSVKGMCVGSKNIYHLDDDANIDTQIIASNTAVNCASYLGYIFADLFPCRYIPIFWDGTIKLQSRWVFPGSSLNNITIAYGYWKAMPIGNGYNLIAIDTTRFDQ